jgi:hypothetical protein
MGQDFWQPEGVIGYSVTKPSRRSMLSGGMTPLPIRNRSWACTRSCREHGNLSTLLIAIESVTVTRCPGSESPDEPRRPHPRPC